MSKDYYNKPKDFEDMQVYVDKVEEAKKEGKPVAVQALWDGDTQGWYIYMQVVIENEDKKELPTNVFLLELIDKSTFNYTMIDLCSLRFASDIRLFNGQPTPWEETIVAKKIGNYISKRYNIPFWFPASEAPDNDCPSWLQRNQGIHCADCNKLIIPTDSPYLPKDICYSCHTERKSKKEFNNDVSTNDELTIYKVNSDADKNNFASYKEWMMTQVKDKGIYSILDTILYEKNTDIEKIEAYKLYDDDLKKILLTYEDKVTEFLKTYDEEKIRKLPKQDYLHEIQYKNNNYFVHQFFDRKVIDNINTVESLQSVIDNEQYLYLFFSRNKTRQLNAIMAFIKTEEDITLQKIVDYYSSVGDEKYRVALSKEQINKNIQRLAERGYISIDKNEVVSLTFKGNFY
ncbi:hypothetical protein [Bernardetia sp.]|uniref:hypothetical protein n=1 Tax=Bernardetia sp. TaxID=1937974 RepID=UPI0025BEEA5A|nr:hypothetical protein [Bernardetia sp.]